MRRESSTVVAMVGEVREALLAEVSRSPNVSVVPSAKDDDGVEAAAAALREASGRASPFVLVPADPLAAVASGWRAMWDLSHGPQAAAEFELRAGEALAAWRAGRFELPDYYLVLAPVAPAVGAAAAGGAGGAGAGASGAGTGAPDLHLGPLRAARPRRVAVVGPADVREQAARVRATLRSLPYGPWWPPLDELIDTTRRFFAGGLAEGEGSLATPALG
jgi:hypothetical protein